MRYVCIRCEELIDESDAIRDEDGDYFHESCYKEYLAEENDEEDNEETTTVETTNANIPTHPSGLFGFWRDKQ